MNHLFLCVFCLVSSVLVLRCDGQSHWFNEVVKNGAVDCFYEVLEERVPVRATAVVVDGGRLDIRLIVQHSYDMHESGGAKKARVLPRHRARQVSFEASAQNQRVLEESSRAAENDGSLEEGIRGVMVGLSN